MHRPLCLLYLLSSCRAPAGLMLLPCCASAVVLMGSCCSPAVLLLKLLPCSCCVAALQAADDLRVIKELPIKASKDACFSNGGHYFAAVNNNAVHVYCTHTCASLAVLRGHNGKVGGSGGVGWGDSAGRWWLCDP